MDVAREPAESKPPQAQYVDFELTCRDVWDAFQQATAAVKNLLSLGPWDAVDLSEFLFEYEPQYRKMGTDVITGWNVKVKGRLPV